MALVQAPDGRSFYVPDSMGQQYGVGDPLVNTLFNPPPSPLIPPAPEPPPPAPPPPLVPQWNDDSGVQGKSGDPTRMPQFDPHLGWYDPYTGHPSFPTPAGRTPIRDDKARIGQGDTASAEVAGSPVRSVTGGQLQTAMPDAPQAGARPDYLLATVDNDPKVIAAKEKAYAKAQAEQAKQAKAQAAYMATPEGQIQQATVGAVGEKQQQAQTAEQMGETESAQRQAEYEIKMKGLADAEAAQQRANARAAQWQQAKIDTAKKIDQAITAEANYKVDDNRRYHKLGTGQKVMFWISAALSGLGEALQKKSGQNMPIQMLQQAIQDDVASQWREKDALGKQVGYAKGRLDNYRQLADDDAQAQQFQVAAEYKKTADQIDAIASKYQGEQAKLRASQMASDLRLQADQIVGSAAEQKIARQVRQQELANARSQIGLGYANLTQRKFEFKEQLKLDQDKIRIQAAQLEAQGKSDQAKFINEHAIGGATVAKLDDNGQPVLDDKGQPVLEQTVLVAPYASKEKLTEIQTQKAAADNIVQLMDESMRLRQHYGWSSDLWKSKEWQQLKANWAALKLEVKDFAKLGVIAGPDEKLMDSFLGTGDPTKVQDPLAGMQQGRDNVVRKFNNTLRSVGSTQVYAPPQVGLMGPENTPEDVAFKETLKKPTALETATELSKAETLPERQAVFSRGGGIQKSQQDEINALRYAMNDKSKTPAQRDAARTRLMAGAQQGQTQEIKDAYSAALAAAATEAIPLSKD